MCIAPAQLYHSYQSKTIRLYIELSFISSLTYPAFLAFASLFRVVDFTETDIYVSLFLDTWTHFGKINRWFLQSHPFFYGPFRSYVAYLPKT